MIAVLAGLFPVSLAYGQPSDPPASAGFRDVPPTHWAYEAIQTGVERGYINGFPDGTFRPNDPVSAAQFIKMAFLSLTDDSMGFVWWSEKYLNMVPEWFRRNLNNDTTSFEEGTPWYKNYIDTAKNNGFIHDEFDGRFEEPITREQAAKFISSLDSTFRGQHVREYSMLADAQLFKDFDRVDFYLQESVGDVALRGIMVGNNGYFNPKGTITRAEAAKICLLLMDDSRRAKVNVSLDGVPYSIVPNPSYGGTLVFIFANEEMKRVYDEMYSRLKDYPGATYADVDGLTYFENEQLRDESVRAFYFMDIENWKVRDDFGISFSGNVYGLGVATAEGRLERASGELKHFLSLIFEKEAESVYRLIESAVLKARRGENETVKQTVEGRQIVLVSHGDALNIGISAYRDQKETEG
ncbi:S-layer homology domain-containing protein [Cohnella thermotolerans]|uniref:S-layer homology domain-containing protein n=1 Tax=Cohnella thermotolerans TaxID=329858 RepID=UPI001F0A87C6|nr:S-layer homology domain-containing protein [Cohnella thermotolerans]